MPSPTKSSNTSLTPSDPTLSAEANAVLKWLLKGNSETDIMAAIQEQFPQHQGAVLLTEVVQHIERSGKANSVIVRGFVFEATRDLYRRMIEIGDFANALRALKLLHDIAGK